MFKRCMLIWFHGVELCSPSNTLENIWNVLKASSGTEPSCRGEMRRREEEMRSREEERRRGDEEQGGEGERR